MLRIAFILFAALVLSCVADGAECGNCHGSRIVGAGAVRMPCPVCDGTGHMPDTQTKPGSPRPAICRITADQGGSQIAGSGVLVAVSGTTGTVLTNWHVVRSHRNSLAVSWPDGTSSPARVMAMDEQWDLASLSVARPAAPPVAIAAKAPQIGDRLTIAGYGPTGKYLEQSGPVTGYLSPTKSHIRQFVEVRAAARQGDSGGPMFTEAGELAGVLFGQRDGLTCGSCSTRLTAFLESTPRCRDGRCVKP